MNILKEEIHYNEILIRLYFLYAFCFSIISGGLLSLMMINGIIPVWDIIGPSFLTGFIFLGPFLILFSPFTERSFTYRQENPSYIKSQIERMRYILVNQNENHFVYKLNNGRNPMNLKIVLIFNQDNFIVYGPKRTIEKLVDSCVWRDYNFATSSDNYSSHSQN